MSAPVQESIRKQTSERFVTVSETFLRARRRHVLTYQLMCASSVESYETLFQTCGGNRNSHAGGVAEPTGMFLVKFCLFKVNKI
jgi:hypothetical protein